MRKNCSLLLCVHGICDEHVSGSQFGFTQAQDRIHSAKDRSGYDMAPYAAERSDFGMGLEFWDIFQAIWQGEGFFDQKVVEQAEDLRPDIPAVALVPETLHTCRNSRWLPPGQSMAQRSGLYRDRLKSKWGSYRVWMVPVVHRKRQQPLLILLGPIT
jgi:hypothetical protein